MRYGHCPVCGMPNHGPSDLSRLIGIGPRMHAIRELMLMTAADRCAVIVAGEPGTGRHLVARLLHALAGGSGEGEPARSISVVDTRRPTPPHTLRILLPSLRDRREDIPVLTDHFLGRGLAAGRRSKVLSASARASLHSYSWPGNVRQLQEVCAWIDRHCEAARVTRGSLPARIQRELTTRAPVGAVRLGLESQLRELESTLIVQALIATGYNRSRAARLLQVKRSTLGDRIRRLDIDKRLTEEVA